MDDIQSIVGRCSPRGEAHRISNPLARPTALLAALALTAPAARAEAPALGNAYSNIGLNTYFTDKNSNLFEFVQTTDGYFGIQQTWNQLTGTGGRPSLAESSGLATYQNTISNINEQFYLADVGGSMHVEEVYGPQNKHSDLTVKVHAHAAETGSAVVGFIDGCAQADNVFFVGGDHHVHLLRWTQRQGWTTSDLTALTGDIGVSGTALAGQEGTASEELFFIGKDRHVHEFWQWSGCSGSPSADGWHHADLNEANGNGAPAALEYSPLTAFSDQGLGDDTGQGWLDAVFYVDAGHHVRELYFSNSVTPYNEWRSRDVTAQSGAPAAAAKSSLASLLWYSAPAQGADMESVFYQDAGGHLWQLLADPAYDGDSFTWTANDATLDAGGTAGGAVAAIAAGPLTADEDYLYECIGCDAVYWTQMEIKYVGTDHHVHILGYLPGNGIGLPIGVPSRAWQALDMTAGSGAPNATP